MAFETDTTLAYSSDLVPMVRRLFGSGMPGQIAIVSVPHEARLKDSGLPILTIQADRVGSNQISGLMEYLRDESIVHGAVLWWPSDSTDECTERVAALMHSELNTQVGPYDMVNPESVDEDELEVPPEQLATFCDEVDRILPAMDLELAGLDSTSGQVVDATLALWSTVLAEQTSDLLHPSTQNSAETAARLIASLRNYFIRDPLLAATIHPAQREPATVTFDDVDGLLNECVALGQCPSLKIERLCAILEFLGSVGPDGRNEAIYTSAYLRWWQGSYGLADYLINSVEGDPGDYRLGRLVRDALEVGMKPPWIK